MRQAIGRIGKRLARSRHEPRGERARGGDAHLLTEHCTHGAFERIPRARYAQARPALHQRAQQGIGLERPGDASRVGGKIEHAARGAGYLEQRGGLRAPNAQLERRCASHGAYAHDGMAAGRAHRSGVAVLVDGLHAGHGACGQKVTHLRPVIGRTQRQPQHDVGAFGGREPRTTLAAQLARRTPVGATERGIEATHAAEPGGKRDLRDRQVGLVEQTLGEMQAARLREHDGRCPHMTHEQAMQMARTQPHACGKLCHRDLVQHAVLDHAQRATHHCRRAQPGRRPRGGLGPTTQARPEAGCGRRRGRRVVAHVRFLWRGRRTDGPAIDARRRHGDEELAIEARIATQARAPQRVRIETEYLLHGRDDTPGAGHPPAVFGPGRSLRPRGAGRASPASMATASENGRSRATPVP